MFRASVHPVTAPDDAARRFATRNQFRPHPPEAIGRAEAELHMNRRLGACRPLEFRQYARPVFLPYTLEVDCAAARERATNATQQVLRVAPDIGKRVATVRIAPQLEYHRRQ